MLIERGHKVCVKQDSIIKTKEFMAKLYLSPFVRVNKLTLQSRQKSKTKFKAAK